MGQQEFNKIGKWQRGEDKQAWGGTPEVPLLPPTTRCSEKFVSQSSDLQSHFFHITLMQQHATGL